MKLEIWFLSANTEIWNCGVIDVPVVLQHRWTQDFGLTIDSFQLLCNDTSLEIQDLNLHY